jgi:hypothetical protein
MYDPGCPLQIYCALHHHLLIQLAFNNGLHESFQ